ncbi:MAG: hypothetical protein CVV02_05170 [Firmicutes bacterium HGW-Firmicutes-7]|nr:MAG: hypothetical protein CVV02_05170 [Firmicutes bacterium HGW-Firmicutes-7]
MNKKIKIITMLLTALLVIGLVGCGKTTPTESTTDTPGEDTPVGTTDEFEKIAFIVADMANESQAFASKQFQQYAKDYNFEVVILDAKGDAQAETQAVKNAIAQGVKAIFVNPNDINAIIPALTEAKQVGIVVGMFSSDLPADKTDARDFFVGVNDNMAGEAAAQAFLNKFPDGANIVEIGGQSGHDAQIKRHDGFNNIISGTNINVIDFKATNTWSTAEAMAIMEDMIVKNGDEIDGVFCHWDNGATGVIQALMAADMKDVFVVGVDGCRAGFNQVTSGDQSVTIMQNFTTMTQKSLEMARKVIDGEAVEQQNFVPLDIVDIGNIDTFTAPEW